MLISDEMNKLQRFGKRVQTSEVQYRVQRSSAKHETVARGIEKMRPNRRCAKFLKKL